MDQTETRFETRPAHRCYIDTRLDARPEHRFDIDTRLDVRPEHRFDIDREIAFVFIFRYSISFGFLRFLKIENEKSRSRRTRDSHPPRNRVRGAHQIHIDRKIVYRIESDFDIDVKFESRPETLE